MSSNEYLMAEPGGGEMKAVQVLVDKAEKMGLSYSSLTRAKNELGAKAMKKDNYWFWQL